LNAAAAAAAGDDDHRWMQMRMTALQLQQHHTLSGGPVSSDGKLRVTLLRRRPYQLATHARTSALAPSASLLHEHTVAYYGDVLHHLMLGEHAAISYALRESVLNSSTSSEITSTGENCSLLLHSCPSVRLSHWQLVAQSLNIVSVFSPSDSPDVLGLFTKDGREITTRGSIHNTI